MTNKKEKIIKLNRNLKKNTIFLQIPRWTRGCYKFFIMTIKKKKKLMRRVALGRAGFNTHLVRTQGVYNNNAYLSKQSSEHIGD